MDCPHFSKIQDQNYNQFRTERIERVGKKADNTLGNGENDGYLYFLLFKQCMYSDDLIQRVIKTEDCMIMGSYI